jgi:hypothetical protein
MARTWIEIRDRSGTRRLALEGPVTRLGPPGSDAEIQGAGRDELRLFDAPLRLVHVGSGPPPTKDGREVRDLLLASGDALEWRGAEVSLQSEGPALLEEIPLPPEAPLSAGERRAWRRVAAGLQVQLGRVERSGLKRWQASVLSGEFEPDACAEDVLASVRPAGDPAGDDGPLLERAGLLLRDFVMAPLQGGAAGARRRARRAVKGGLALLLSQLAALAVLAAILLAALLLLRLRGTSIDAFLDRMLPR